MLNQLLSSDAKKIKPPYRVAVGKETKCKVIFNPFLTQYISYLICCFFLLSSCNTSEPAAKKTIIKADYAITNVAVLPMTSEQVLTNQTVLIQAGKIVDIGTSTSFEAKNMIDGTAKFLMPGLTEMHAHIPVAEEGNDSLVKETLLLYLSQGITNIRGMLGNPYHLELRAQVANQEIISPRIYTSSPSLNGNSITTPEEARTKITQYQKDGYDFLKIHPGIKLEVWDEVEKTANEVGIPYAGHVPIEVGINRALAAKYKTIDHLDGYLEGLVPASTNVDPSKNGFFGYEFTDLAAETLIDDLVTKTIENKVSIVTTQTLFTRWFSPTPPEVLLQAPEMRYMSPKTLFTWRQSKSQLISGATYDAEKWERYIAIRTKILQKMDAAGVTFLLGSDAPQVFNVPGFSLHHELKAMADAGLSNFKILQAGTVNPALFFDAKGVYGTIEKGAAADLVLLAGNPLEHLENAQKIEGVMLGENWLPKERIDKALSEIAARYAQD